MKKRDWNYWKPLLSVHFNFRPIVRLKFWCDGDHNFHHCLQISNRHRRSNLILLKIYTKSVWYTVEWWVFNVISLITFKIWTNHWIPFLLSIEIILSQFILINYSIYVVHTPQTTNTTPRWYLCNKLRTVCCARIIYLSYVCLQYANLC